MGLEAVYIRVQNGKCLTIPFDDSQEEAGLKLQPKLIFKNENFILEVLTERFVRLHGK